MIRLRYIFLVNGTRRKTEWEAKMPDITLNKIIADATSLAPEDRRRLIEVLRETSPTAGSPESIEQVAAKHGKKPLDFAHTCSSKILAESFIGLILMGSSVFSRS